MRLTALSGQAVSRTTSIGPRITLNIPSDVVYHIEKYIYGLPDSGRAYYLAYSKLLTDSGYIKSKSDPCLFLKFVLNSNDRIYIWIHVDDTFVAATYRNTQLVA